MNNSHDSSYIDGTDIANLGLTAGIWSWMLHHIIDGSITTALPLVITVVLAVCFAASSWPAFCRLNTAIRDIVAVAGDRSNSAEVLSTVLIAAGVTVTAAGFRVVVASEPVWVMVVLFVVSIAVLVFVTDYAGYRIRQYVHAGSQQPG